MNVSQNIRINNKTISADDPTYFIADIAANHDGDLQRAKDLVHLAKEAGADCAKFQHFTADQIVSDVGFRQLKDIETHQSKWKKSVSEIYDQYHAKREWTEELISCCRSVDIEFMTTPYDFEAIKIFEDKINAYKIGSGDITYRDLICKAAMQSKPIILATGASDLIETRQAVDLILQHNADLILLQCNTNYTGSLENFKYVNLNVIKNFQKTWPGIITGLSDHTPGHAAVLGAISLGGRVIEKHFTDDNTRVGPDHEFALNPKNWKEMVDRSRELELALGDGIKRIEPNEANTSIVQRRALRLSKNMKQDQALTQGDLTALRPCPNDAINPMFSHEVIGKILKTDKNKGEHITWDDLNL